MSIHWDAAKGRFRFQWEATIDGQRHRSSKLLPAAWSEAAARAYDKRETARAFARVTARRPVRSNVPLIEQAVKLYLDERVPDLGDSKNTAANLSHLFPFYAGKTLDQLGAVARDFLKNGRTQVRKDKRGKVVKPAVPLGPATARQRLATLRSAASYALKHHSLGSRDWIEAMTMPAVDNDREVHLSRAQVLRVARACKHRAARALILMTFATGSRPGEAHRAKAGDGFLAKRLKNGDMQRMPFHPRFRYLLRHWPMDYGYETLSRHWRRALKDVGLADVHLHDLRHSTASELIRGGATLAEVGLVLNHKSLQSSRRYIHLSTEAKTDVLSRIWSGTKSRTAPISSAPKKAQSA